jgi:hypothetical protein
VPERKKEKPVSSNLHKAKISFADKQTFFQTNKSRGLCPQQACPTRTLKDTLQEEDKQQNTHRVSTNVNYGQCWLISCTNCNQCTAGVVYTVIS